MAYSEKLIGSGYNHYFKLTVLQVRQEVENNRSLVSWKLETIIATNTGYWASYGINTSAIINGTTKNKTIGYKSYGVGTHLLDSGSLWVSHNSDGTKTVSASATLNTNAFGSTSVSTSMTLTTIPRASSFTLSGGTTTGSTINVSISRATSAFTHTVWWKMGSGSWVNVTNSATTSASFSVPHSALPSATSGTITVEVNTYNGNTKIGAKTTTRKLTVPSNIVPSFTTITHSENVSSVNTKVGMYVKNKSRLNIAITGASAGTGSSIKSYKITVAGQTANAVSGLTNVITQSGTLDLIGTVTDNRNRSVSKTVKITVLNYSPPTLTSLTIDRAKSDGMIDPLGTYARIQEQAKAISLKNGSTEKNSITVKVETKQRPSGSWVVKDTFNETGLTSNRIGLYSGYVATSDYDVRITVSDVFESIEITGGDMYIPTGGANLFVGSKGMASSFGKLPTHGNEYDLEIGAKGLHSDGPIIAPSVKTDNYEDMEIKHRFTTEYGYTEIGPMNGSYGHIYTDRPSFYFNKPLLILGKTVATTDQIPTVTTPSNRGFTFAPGWSNYGGGRESVRVIRDGTLVTMSGMAKSTSGNWIGTLPNDCRPPSKLSIGLVGVNGFVRIDISTNGSVDISGTWQSWVSFTGASWYI